MKKKTIYYTSFEQDLVTATQQDYVLPTDYLWEKNQFLSWLTRHGVKGLAKLFCPFYLHWHKAKDTREKRLPDQGCYLYVNHTQTVGDALIPYYLLKKKWPAIIVSPANLSLPIIGSLIPYGGGLPIPNNLRQMRKFNQTVARNIAHNRCVVIYPEAHVWPYYTKIRPFSAGAFHYPAQDNAPVYCLTNTYQKQKFGRKPQITSYLDGPFFAPAELTLQERRQNLQEQVQKCMQERSQKSTYSYIDYQRREAK
ncbi:1-acyl-sn-glycerol-3-phosphate acyltransferase [Ligilactobacillus salitolerans]|uniref:1-acyl-sn-glycerol-3-phosphate acyltransferase n=1 Tax=Ligilactobacillus salitolerans TaxID=1808352 RepID=A0A401IUT0_9LACO|nr:1-acyl-sn-glycerol-3-phosphate acyltransferase [Ligilactobacillus salitolerans]GBG95265.1 1-acyl-sn-glycerol-3-phosphate acyltransferase [Ligilactobacillus salitolerans]